MERFWQKVEKTSSCWLWRGHVKATGYGQVAFERGPVKKKFLAHRVSYELLVGPVPQGLTLDHLCKVRRCVNPAHLEPVTQKENARRTTA